MRWTRLSFVYLVSYLSIGGIGLLVAPELALRLLGATGNYPRVLAQALGAILLALGIVVAQIMRHRVEELYSTTLVVRVLLLGAMAGLYLESRDPFFLVLAAIIGLGMLLTSAGLVADRRARGSPAPGHGGSRS